MKRSTPLRRRTPLTRKTPLRAKAALKPMVVTTSWRDPQTFAWHSRTEHRLVPVERTPARPKLRRSRPKMTPARKNAKGMPCTVCFPGCDPGPDNENVVLCHLRMFGGGGTGLKPHDSEAVFGCMHCHDILDDRKSVWLAEGDSRWEYIARALIRTLRLQREAGVIVLKGES